MNDAAKSALEPSLRLTPAVEKPAGSERATPERGSLPPLATRKSRVAPWYTRLSLADSAALASCITLFVAIVAALVPQWLAPYAPGDMAVDAVLSEPTSAHWFGTDQFGRDVFSLVIFGARQSLLLGLGAVSVSCVIGVSLGIAAGYTGGVLDHALMRSVDVWMAIPSILLAIALSAALGPGALTTIVCVSLASIPRYARVLRAQALSIRARPFILAARASGASHLSILRRHVLPHCQATIVVIATLGIGQAILLGSSLSFLGLGVNDERPDWGYLLTQGRGYLTVAWWTVTYPGLAITLLVISVNLIGDALKRRLDPHSVQHLVLARRARRA